MLFALRLPAMGAAHRRVYVSHRRVQEGASVMESTEICEAGNDHPADLKIVVMALVDQVGEPYAVFACWEHLPTVLVNMGIGAYKVNNELSEEPHDLQ